MDRTTPRDVPWWLSGGELCGFCLYEYVLEAECRCIECDHPVCPMCAVTVRESLHLLCPACDEEARSSGREKTTRTPR